MKTKEIEFTYIAMQKSMAIVIIAVVIKVLR